MIISYTGYGIDLGKLADSLDEPEREILCSGLDAAADTDIIYDVESPEVMIASTGNSFDFKLLFLIPCAYVVFSDGAKEVKTYSVSEANACLMETITDYVRACSDLCRWSQDEEFAVLDAIEGKFDQFVGFDGEKGPWSDSI